MMSSTGPSQGPSPLTRRHFLTLAGLTTAGFLTGCAANPVTGERQLMLVSEQQEIDIDRQHSPHQFSADYGVAQDEALNNYLASVGKKMGANTHRSHMPYRFKCVNATYVNAYAFPGGTIASTRGILLSLENEAELAALLGHELGHVNARHTARQMSKGTLVQAVMTGVAAVAGTYGDTYGDIAGKLGQVGAGVLLARYSRDNEREADALGIAYMTKTRYGANGFVGLMDMLRSMSKHKPNAIELMFATHPMSDERYATAVAAVEGEYAAARKLPLHKERYMDNTASLRRIAPAIEAMQQGQQLMGAKKYGDAQASFAKALKQAPKDYAGLVMMAKCQLAQNKHDAAARYADKAKKTYPAEAQGHHVGGFANLQRKRFDAALEDFTAVDKLLPGNPNTQFFKGYALEGMQRREPAAKAYYAYLQQVRQGKQAQHAYQRLVEWGYIKK